ncbi:MAG: metal-dependent hydrolase [Verrucomicrobium sp.]|nr:metal-dependent hydrolase [Verrucomicrobium sp.]
MDPLTHSFLGMATAMVATSARVPKREAALAGLAAGLLPDSDVFLRNAADPLFFIEYHRHFTHSLAFSPVIAVLAVGIAWALYRVFARRSIAVTPLLLPAWLAGLSHIFCDLWTSYGTRVWWPFSDAREALDWVAVVDPVLTVPLVIATTLALTRKRLAMAVAGLTWVALYLGLAVLQHHRAKTAVEGILAQRGMPAPERITVKPSFANILVWRAMVQDADGVEVLAVRTGLGEPTIIASPGLTRMPMYASPEDAIKAFKIAPESAQAGDVRRFFHFSDGWVGAHPDDALTLGDLRYANLPDEIRPLWGIRLRPAERQCRVEWKQFTNVDPSEFERLWNMVLGRP